jgi:hypothetical protein
MGSVLYITCLAKRCYEIALADAAEVLCCA